MSSDTSSKQVAFKWELIGIFLIIVFGSFFHFVFELFGRWPPVSIIAAVNESVWEHLKLAFWPALIYAMVEYFYLKDITKNFWIAKSIGIFSIPLIIVLFFYLYTTFTGHHILWVDIALFGFSVAVGQMISFLLMIQRPFSSMIKVLGAILLIFMILAFSIFSYLPPKLPIFQDSTSGQYGLTGIDETIQFEGKSDPEIQDILEKLRKKARIKNAQ